MIVTERLILRTFNASDQEALYGLFSDQEVMKYSTTGTKTTEEVGAWLIARMEERASDQGIEILAVISKSFDAVIGYCGLFEFTTPDGLTEIQIGYRLIRKYWGNGFASEAASAVRDHAFSKLQLTKLVALIEPTNKRSIAAACNIGMSYQSDMLLPEYDYPDRLYVIEA
jgi:RimJ/RimL family protein N-acetyltransferase